MNKITELTKEQWELVYARREEWRRIGTSTEPADRPATETVLKKFYARLGKKEPKFVWFDGPFSACVLTPLLLGGQLGGQLWDQLGSQLWGQLWDQ